MTVQMSPAADLALDRIDLVRPARPDTSPVKLLSDFHRAVNRPAVVLADMVLVLAAGWRSQLSITASTVLAVLVVGGLLLTGRYRRRSPLESQGIGWHPSLVLGPAIVALAIVGHLFSLPASRTALVATWSIVALVGPRAAAWAVLTRLRSRGVGLAATMVVGSGSTVERAVGLLRSQRHLGLDPILTLEADDQRLRNPVLLTEMVVTRGIDQVLVAGDSSVDDVLDVLRYLRGPMVDVAVIPQPTSLFLDPDRFSRVGGIALVPVGSVGQAVHRQMGKRTLDVVVAGAALVLLSPLLAVVALAIKLGDGGPVFYRQQRVGRWGRTFSLVKFRSMVPEAENLVIDLRTRNASDGLLFKVESDPRVTAVGRLIRRLSIDELPQLVNVLRGEMSLVGPRPLPVEPTAFGERDGLRHAVLPGITGLWQVSGDNGLTYEEMIRLDLAYVRSWSLWLDLRLMSRTVPALLRRLGPS